MKISIIGAGIGGLATSIRLAAKGYEIHVFEANNYVGGKLSEIKSSGFRFDAGPSLFTMPNLLHELFKTSNRKTRKYFEYQKLNVACKYFYEDNTQITAYTDSQVFANEIEQKTGVVAQVIINYLAQAKEKYDLTHRIFLEKSLHKWQTYFSKDVLKALSKIHKLQILENMNDANEKLLKEKHLIQLFNRFATYNGSNPYKTPAILCMIPHLEHNLGTFFPKNGMISIPQSLYQLAKDIGVNFHLGEKVKEIVVEGKKTTGIKRENSAFFASDIVVSNADIVPTYRYLMPTQKAPERTLQQERSSSALIFYWGINATFEQLDLHNIFFSQHYKAEFKAIFEEFEVYEDPTVYINISSKYNKKDAPKNCENWFTMINVPHCKNQDWDKIIAVARQNIIKKLNRMLKTDIEKLIVCENILDPRGIEQKTSSYLGALYGASSNSRFSAFGRHPNFSKRIKNLYFCGGSVHPGGGIPLCLLSAKITSDLIESAHA